jgi:hypothetical protein
VVALCNFRFASAAEVKDQPPPASRVGGYPIPSNCSDAQIRITAVLPERPYKEDEAD